MNAYGRPMVFREAPPNKSVAVDYETVRLVNLSTGGIIAPLTQDQLQILRDHLEQESASDTNSSITHEMIKVKLAFSSWNGVKTWEKKHASAHQPAFELVDGAPNLVNIFDDVPGNSMTVAFKKNKRHFPPNHEDHLTEFGDPHGHLFYERMYATIDASNNATAGSCILDVGYPYIASTLMQAGLFSPERDGGLWLSAPYPGVSNAVLWVENPLPMHEQIVNGRVNKSRHYQVASPAAGAAFMPLLAQDRLVSPQASQEMKFLMNKKKPATGKHSAGSATTSPVKSSLEKLGLTVKTAYSKIGLIDKSLSDCALIEREVEVAPPPDRKTKLVRYVVCVVDPPVDQWYQWRMGTLVQGLDQCIRETNGLP